MVSYIKNNNNNNVTDYDNNINNTDNIRLLPCSILLIILKIIILIINGIGTNSYFLIKIKVIINIGYSKTVNSSEGTL